MNREIKFRGKRVDNNEWVYGDMVRHIKINNKTMYTIWEFNGKFYEVIPETVGQFTGLEDKNGKKIYEGDIVKIYGGEFYGGYYEYNHICKVEWQTNGFELITIKDNCGLGWGFCCDPENIIILGNIHENKELLEEI